MTVLAISTLYITSSSLHLQHDGSLVFHVRLDHSSYGIQVPLSLSRSRILSRQHFRTMKRDLSLTMEETRNVNDTEVLMLGSGKLDGQDIIGEPSLEIIDILLGTRRKTHGDGSLDESAGSGIPG